jgi:hypothetical protein
MFAETSTVLRAVEEDFLFNCWYLEFPSDNRGLKYRDLVILCCRIYLLHSIVVIITIVINWRIYFSSRCLKLLSASYLVTGNLLPLH